MAMQADLAAIEQGINLWWRAIGKLEGFTLSTGDIEYVLSPNRSGPERIFDVRIGEGHARRVNEIAEAMKAGALPGGMLLTPLSTPGNIADMMAQRGLAIDNSSPCMALDLPGFHPATKPNRIEVTEVTDCIDLVAWAGIVNQGLFGCDLFSLEQYQGLLKQENTSLYLTSLDGKAASACMTIRGEGVATLECVATLPDYRRRGLARAAVSHALERLKGAGTDIATLRSEPDGVNLYKGFGFRECCKRTVASV